VAIDQASTQRWMEQFAQAMSEHRQELVRLDTAIGDGDHGTNMDRGMQRALEKLAAEPPPDPGAVLKSVAMTLIASVGGAAGPLYGTLLLQLGNAMAGQPEVELAAYAQAWRRAAEAVMARGKAQPGDKTMVDALLPAVDALEQAEQTGTELSAALRAAAEAAREGMLATVPLLARRGRASYLAERSTGHQDPGATSTYHLFQSAADALSD
jgi:dihydroxyacetone kinase-like protein